ncbi:MAG: hypothetical protein VX527_09315 [Planctomycetota bacterium]|nr:hypothetical protein [Planctomycetota bacterium]
MSSLLIPISLCSVLSIGIDVVELRDGRGELTGTVQASDMGSLRLEMTDGKRQQIPWDLVRSIRFEDPGNHPGGMKERLQRADDIWRARSRLQRGDVELAEPLFEQLFEPSIEHRDETDLIIAEGLLRCRLSRGELVEALVPALETARLRGLGVQTDRYDDLSVIYDPSTQLCIYLPPAWPQARPLPRLIQQLENWDAGGNEDLARIASKYRILVEFPVGTVVGVHSAEVPDVGQDVDSSHLGVKLLELALQSRNEDP